MQLNDMYQKPIDRPIDSVIKASSVEHLANELEEYIITPDVAGHLQAFFDEYNDPDATGNGAWISGFFGSGKSHLLKILAVALEDREVAGKRALDYLLPKLDGEASLRAAMETARERHPSESVLFNVDIEAENTGRATAGDMLSAFIRAFNRHRGYFAGSQQFVAQLECDLDKEGKLGDFKRSVLERTGKDWDDIRSHPQIYAAKITGAFDEACGNEPGTHKNIVGEYSANYKPSISSFAAEVADYIAQHGRGFRLNFFVDEVGQFIAQDEQRMINLQSIVEELNTACGGNSWVVVTSQEDVEQITGRMKSSAANDFSKIQGRFKVRMSLRSEDAEDIIKQRLLAKQDAAKPGLRDLYCEREDDFEYLFAFADGSPRYPLYEDEDDFVRTYPFVPYQFTLFISAMRRLSDHGALQGQHKSTGARSMLGVFQEVAIRLGREHRGEAMEEEPLAAFDAMFDGLRGDLKSEFYGQVSLAERNLADNPLAIRVLKALLLVKYCDFRATPTNLRILLYGSFCQDVTELEDDIEDALEVLEAQAFVRRAADGSSYEYLTNEEKDVESEIQLVELSLREQHECVQGLCKDVIGGLRATYHNMDFSHVYYFNLKVDGEPMGPQRNDLSIDIVTDFDSEEGGMFARVPSAPKTLSIVLRGDEGFLREMSVYLKTTKYINVDRSDGSRRGIIEGRRDENVRRSAQLHKDFEALLTDASYYVAGMDVTDKVKGSGKEAVFSGMTLLVERSYPLLQQLTTPFSDNTVFDACHNKQVRLEDSLPEYVQSVLDYVRMANSSIGATVGGDGPTSLIRRFGQGEYGWPELATLTAVGVLYAAGRVEVRQADKVLEEAELADKLKHRRQLDKLVVRPVEEIDAATLRRIADAYRDLVGTTTNSSDDAKATAQSLAISLGDEVEALEKLGPQLAGYPFERRFAQETAKLRQARVCLETDWRWIATGFLAQVDDLVACRNDLNAMRQFITSSRKGLFDGIRDFCDHDLDEARELRLSSMEDQEAVDAMLDFLVDEDCYKSGDLPKVNRTLRAIKSEMAAKKKELRAQVEGELEDYRRSFVESCDMEALGQESRERFEAVFEEGRRELAQAQRAHQLNSFMEGFKERHGDEIVLALKPRASAPTAPAAAEAAAAAAGEPVATVYAPAAAAGEAAAVTAAVAAPAAPQAAYTAPATVQLKELKARSYSKPTIETPEDVDAYLDALRGDLLAQLRAGRIVMK